MNGNITNKGFSLIEVIIAIAVGVIIVVIASSLLLTRSKTIDNVTTTKAAENVSEDALSVLSSKASGLILLESYSPVDESTISVSECTEKTCDFILEPDASVELKTSPAGGVLFSTNYVPPIGHRVVFLRRWRVNELNTEYSLRRIGVAILINLESTSPISLQETTVAINR